MIYKYEREIFMKLSRNDSRVLAMAILYQVDLFNRKKIDYDLEDIISKNILDISDDVKRLGLDTGKESQEEEADSFSKGENGS